MNIYFNTAKMELVDRYGGKEIRIPRIVYGVRQKIRVILTSDGMSPFDLSVANSFEVALDSDRDSTSVPVCFAERDSVMVAENALEFEFNTSTEEFFNRVNGKGQVSLICEICGFSTTGELICRFDFPMLGIMSVGDANSILPTALPEINARLAQLAEFAENIIGGQ